MIRKWKKLASVALATSLFFTSIPAISFGADETLTDIEISIDASEEIAVETATITETGAENHSESEQYEKDDEELLLADEDSYEIDEERMMSARQLAEERAQHYLSVMQEEYDNGSDPLSFAGIMKSFGSSLGKSVLGGFVGYGINKLMDAIFGNPMDEKLEQMQKKLDEICQQMGEVKTMVSQISDKIDEIMKDTSEIKKGVRDLLKYSVCEKLSGYMDDMKKMKTETVRITFLALKDVDLSLENGEITKEQAEQERISLLLDSFGIDSSNPNSCATITSYIDLYTEGMSNALNGNYSVMMEDMTIVRNLSIFDVYYEILKRDSSYQTQDDANDDLLEFYINAMADYNITTAVEGLSLNARIKVIEDYNKKGEKTISTRALKNALKKLQEKNSEISMCGTKFISTCDTKDYLYLWKDELFVSKKLEETAGTGGENRYQFSSRDDAKANLKSLAWDKGAPTEFANNRSRRGTDRAFLGSSELNPDPEFWSGLWHGWQTGREFISKAEFLKILDYGRSKYPDGGSDEEVLKKIGFDMPSPVQWDKSHIIFRPTLEDPLVYETIGDDFGQQLISAFSYPGGGWYPQPLFQYETLEVSGQMVGHKEEFYGFCILSERPTPNDPIIDDYSHHTYFNRVTQLYTGTPEKPVADGIWTLDQNGIWHYATTQVFRNTWGYIVNPFAREGQNKVDWFWFDANGNMLVGWQYINGKWYYLNPVKDSTYGACLIGPAWTPDGYEVDASGAWTGKKR